MINEEKEDLHSFKVNRIMRLAVQYLMMFSKRNLTTKKIPRNLWKFYEEMCIKENDVKQFVDDKTSEYFKLQHKFPQPNAAELHL